MKLCPREVSTEIINNGRLSYNEDAVFQALKQKLTFLARGQNNACVIAGDGDDQFELPGVVFQETKSHYRRSVLHVEDSVQTFPQIECRGMDFSSWNKKALYCHGKTFVICRSGDGR